MTRYEEEAAVREAIEAIKQKKKGEQSDGGSTED